MTHMTQLEPHCADCGSPITSGELCSACAQDRTMQRAQVEKGEI